MAAKLPGIKCHSWIIVFILKLIFHYMLTSGYFLLLVAIFAVYAAYCPFRTLLKISSTPLYVCILICLDPGDISMRLRYDKHAHMHILMWQLGCYTAANVINLCFTRKHTSQIYLLFGCLFSKTVATNKKVAK